MGYTPTDVNVDNSWSLGGRTADASFTLNSRHTVRYRREEKILEQIIHLYVDGTEVLSRRLSSISFTDVRHSFKLDGVDCLFTYTWAFGGAVGKLEVGGVTIF